MNWFRKTGAAALMFAAAACTQATSQDAEPDATSSPSDTQAAPDASAPPASPAIKDAAALNAVVDGFVESGAYPVVYVRLENRNGEVFYEHAAVNRELIPDATIDGDTWFRIWSMSKIVTITTVLDLIEDGVLAFDDPVAKYVPEFDALDVARAPDGGALLDYVNARADAADGGENDEAVVCPLPTEPVTAPMTVRHLLNHTAGFYYTYGGVPCLPEAFAAQDLAASTTSDDLIGRMQSLPLIQQPGASYFYGMNTTVLGLVAERATGAPLKTLVAERVTGPLGIEDLRYGLPEGAALLPRFSGQDGVLRVAQDGELDIFGQSLPGYDRESALYLGGEGMVGTADAYTDFIRMLLGRGELNGVRILDDATVSDLTSPHTQLDSPWGHNGYNLWVNSGRLSDGTQGVGGLWIGGGYEGTYFWIDTEREFVGVIMSQIFWVPEAGANRDEIIREAVYGQLVAER